MKGYAMLKIGEAGWIEKDRPVCGPLDAIVRPLALSPCTSDVHTVYEGAIGERVNAILGHEAVGEIVEVGAMVKDFKVGDRVIVGAITPHWGTKASQAGYSVHCDGMLSGYMYTNIIDGSMAEFFSVPEADANLALIPEGMDLPTAVMITDMMPTGFHGVELADVQFGDTVCVIGIGPVGLMAVAGAALRGAANIYAVGSRELCAQVAREFGATDIINYKNGDIVEQIMALTNNEGVDKVIIAGGDCDTMIQAVNMVKAGGKIGNINYLSDGDYIRIPRAGWGSGMGHKQINGGLMYAGRLRMEKFANLVMTGRVDPSKLITHTFHGLENCEAALNLMKNKPRDLIKPVVIID